MSLKSNNKNQQDFLINEINVQNFKSFKQIKINLRKLNVIIGKNDSGSTIRRRWYSRPAEDPQP